MRAYRQAHAGCGQGTRRRKPTGQNSFAQEIRGLSSEKVADISRKSRERSGRCAVDRLSHTITMGSIIAPCEALASIMTVLTTPRLTLRHWRESDLEPFATLNADPVTMEFMARCLHPLACGHGASRDAARCGRRLRSPAAATTARPLRSRALSAECAAVGGVDLRRRQRCDRLPLARNVRAAPTCAPPIRAAIEVSERR